MIKHGCEEMEPSRDRTMPTGSLIGALETDTYVPAPTPTPIVLNYLGELMITEFARQQTRHAGLVNICHRFAELRWSDPIVVVLDHVVVVEHKCVSGNPLVEQEIDQPHHLLRVVTDVAVDRQWRIDSSVHRAMLDVGREIIVLSGDIHCCGGEQAEGMGKR